MKPLNIKLNIGLLTTERQPVSVRYALNLLTACGITITDNTVALGEWDGKPEPTLVVSGVIPAEHFEALHASLETAAGLLCQDCIAYKVGPTGALAWRNSTAPSCEFNQDFWTPAFRVAETWNRPLAAPIAPDSEAFGFIGWLESTLIPDLRADGPSGTADDIETLIAHYRNLARKAGQI